MPTAAEECPAASTVASFSQEEVDKLMSQGKRHFLGNEILEAVKCFQEACRMLGSKYGQTANECGDAYHQYGKSLLELARLENGVLGNALNEVPIEEANSEDEEKLGAVGPKIKDIPPEEKEAVREDVKCAMAATNEEDEGDDSGMSEDNEAENTEDNKETDNAKNVSQDNVQEKSGELTGAGAAEKNIGEEEEAKDEQKKEEASVEKKEVDESENVSKAEVETSEEKKDEMKVETKDDEVKGEGAEGETKEDGKEEGKEEIKGDGTEEGKEEDEGEEMDEDANEGDGEETKGKGDDEEITDPDAVPTIQLAWEMLELARIIFRRMNDKEGQLKLAQTHLLLGEINMEQEQFTDAISEITKCSNIQKTHLQPDNRLLAETYYTLGLAYTLSMIYDKSAQQYELAIEVLSLRIKNIKDRMAKEEELDKGKGKASGDDPYVKDRKELSELEELLPEVQEKCIDAKNESTKTKELLKEQLGETLVGFGCSQSCSSSTAQQIEVKKADDINHLVKRSKRKPDAESSEDNKDAPAKKSRQENENTSVTNGNNATTNGKPVTTTADKIAPNGEPAATNVNKGKADGDKATTNGDPTAAKDDNSAAMDTSVAV